MGGMMPPGPGMPPMMPGVPPGNQCHDTPPEALNAPCYFLDVIDNLYI